MVKELKSPWAGGMAENEVWPLGMGHIIKRREAKYTGH